MPIYEYGCPVCDHRFELRQGFNDPSEATCPKCLEEARRLIQPVGIVFKGSGWHITDNRRASSASLNGNGESEGDSSESKDKDSSAPKESKAESTATKTAASSDA
jgi:putative FmdB family regulatory protein